MYKVLFRVASLCALLAASLIASPAQAAGKEYCADYAQNAVDQYQQAAKSPDCLVIIQQNNLRWQPFYQNHYNGCKIFGRTVSEAEQEARRSALSQCVHNN